MASDNDRSSDREGKVICQMKSLPYNGIQVYHVLLYNYNGWEVGEYFW